MPILSKTMMKNKATTVSFFILFVLSLKIMAQNKQTSFVIEKGIASYYGKAFNGRKTSSGEIFYSDSLTAAHKSLKFGTMVKVTNISNDSSVIVKINDRLPKSSKRCIDLSYRSAQKLGFIKKGVAKVVVEVINKPQ